MNKVRNALCLFLVICCIAAMSAGCGSSSSGGGTTKKTEKEKYFTEKQAPTVTTNGKIKMDTVQQMQDGKIQYQTDDGKTWRVDMTKQADGTYRYGTPDEVK